MSVYNGEEYCTVDGLGYEALFSHDRGTETLTVKDNLISDATVAEARARAELLKGGYVERNISITTIQTPNLKQNDIIRFQGVNWIVKEISLQFKVPKLIQTIKGVRYE
jgi:hypothetical protein